MTTIGDIADLVLGQLVTELRRDGGNPDELCTVAVLHGEIAPFDYAGLSTADCGAGGMAWVRLISANPTRQFPNNDTGASTCFDLMAYPMEIGVIRPADIGDELADGSYDLPSMENVATERDRQYKDMYAMRRALKKVKSGDRIDQLVLSQYTPYGPEGAVIGGVWTFTVGTDSEDDPLAY